MWLVVLLCLSLSRKCVICFHSAALIILVMCASFTLNKLLICLFSFFFLLFLASQKVGKLVLMIIFFLIQIQHVVTPPNQR